ncbi:hypothetical protein [Paenibacillus typhae]|uniref:hypothetical protein n=1 Tax=Paenibacillus typhae TaxID=1174501 RepID=UPI001C8D728A|nr:hypothetical protein [Paenibacillus typhae]
MEKMQKTARRSSQEFIPLLSAALRAVALKHYANGLTVFLVLPITAGIELLVLHWWIRFASCFIAHRWFLCF